MLQKRDPNVAELILLLACFDNRDIWYELVKCGSNSLSVPAWFDKTMSNGLAFKISMRTLIGFSPIETKQQEGSYAMHPVMQDWCLHIAVTEDNANLMQLNELALVSVGSIILDKDDRIYSELQRRLLPHANYILQGKKGDFWGENVTVWGAFDGLGF